MRTKARLDHIGIAVNDLDAALAFYRDALGLDVEAPRTWRRSTCGRISFPSVNPRSSCSRPQSPDSASPDTSTSVARASTTSRCASTTIDAVLADLKGRGVRLVDAEARPGAEGSRVAFIHPAAAHGVLVELKQARPQVEQFRTAGTTDAGDVELITLCDGFFHLDGGAMFGVVPRTLWGRATAAGRSQSDYARRCDR